jgi:glucose-1-phosphate thymidylyltransferase
MMIEQGCKFRTAPVKEWLDCGLPETLIATNTWLLQNRPTLNNICHIVSQNKSMNNVKLIPPCNIGKNVIIENSTIGPNVTIGDNSVIKNASIQNCVIWKNEEVHSSQISGQVIAKC